MLGYKLARKALADHVDVDDVLKWNVTDSLGRTQATTIINESGVYSLILRSKLPEAKQFKRWVTSEVLPAIRKHGGYLTPDKVEEALLNPDTIIKLAQALKDEQAKNVALTRDRDYLQNKVNTTSLPQLVKKRTRAGYFQ